MASSRYSDAAWAVTLASIMSALLQHALAQDMTHIQSNHWQKVKPPAALDTGSASRTRAETSTTSAPFSFISAATPICQHRKSIPARHARQENG